MKEAGGVTADNFQSGQGKLWLAVLIVSPVLAAAFAAFAVLYADDGPVVLIGCILIALAALALFCVCIAAAKKVTSRWTADEEGVSYFCCGRRKVFLRWEDIREAGFLYLGGEARSSRVRLYWSAAELRGRLKGGRLAGRAAGLDANRTGAQMIVYPVPAFYGEGGGILYPDDDPLIAFTRTHARRPLRHEGFLHGTQD